MVHAHGFTNWHEHQEQCRVLSLLAFSSKLAMPQPRLKVKRVRTNRLRKIRVLLSSHHSLVRSGVSALIERVKKVEVGEVLDHQQILDVIEEFQPDVILLDVMTSGVVELELLKRVTNQFPAIGVIALTERENPVQAVQALSVGAAGLISRNATSNDLALAIKTVAKGENYLSETLRRAVLKHSETPRVFFPKLSARQYEVLKLMAEGHTTKEIALRLHISAKTVETHQARIKKRLNIRNLAGLVRYAVRMGVIKLDE